MKHCEFFLITAFDGDKWGADELVEQTPIPRVRELLGGRWERSSQWSNLPLARAFFNGDKRVLVMGVKPGWTKDQALEALKEIHQGREDLS